MEKKILLKVHLALSGQWHFLDIPPELHWFVKLYHTMLFPTCLRTSLQLSIWVQSLLSNL